MSPYQQEELDNIRRQAERGRELAYGSYDHPFVDYFQAIIDLVQAIKGDNH